MGLRSVATTGRSDKPYYVTTPIFYVNAAPHVGHMYTMILADVMKRWQILKGRNSVLCTGTDEHGLKIQQAAANSDSDPQTFCDKGAQIFKDLAARINMSYDHFVRTSDKSHKEAVEYAWIILQERGYIFRSKHEGWYAVSDEAFYPDSAVQLILDPRTGKKVMVSKETGNEVHWSSEDNYHFRLSAFRERLLEFYKANPNWITPAHRMKEVVASVEAGLEDLSVSRPYDRLKWAVRVPTDQSQSIYVWLDALLNYASKAGYPWPPNAQNQSFWPADIHVIGKDIVRFHCVYWPAFLMALDLPMPRRIMTHAHWTMDSQKMSKSRGNVVNPFWAMDRFGIEVMRYFLIHHGGLEDDSDYDNSIVAGRYKTDLQDRLGNLASRVLQAQFYNPQTLRERYTPGQPEALETDCRECQPQTPPKLEAAKRAENWSLLEYRQMLLDLPGKADAHFQKMEPNKALHTIMTTVYAANAFMQNHEPWKVYGKLGKALVEDDTVKAVLERRLSCIVFLMSETLRITAILLKPYIPEKANELLDTLAVDASRREFADTRLGSDGDYGKKLAKGEKLSPLFPPLVNIS